MPHPTPSNRWLPLIGLLALVGPAACGGGGSSGGAGGGNTYAIGGTVSGLASGASVVLQDNGADNLTVVADGSFTFATQLASGAAYRVTVLTQPSGQTCSVAGGSGTVAAVPVTSVQVSCGAASYAISGTITPAASGAGVAVTLGGAASATTFTDGSGHYTFGGLADGAYTVAPAAPDTTFAPSSAAVTVAGADVTTVDFTSTAKVVFFDDFAGSALSSAWTVISRHGEYSQSETECNIPQQVAVANGLLSITTAATPYTCGDFNIDGTVRTAPAQWPYVTGDVQWTHLNFTYGTVTVRAKFPAQATGLWPAIWLLDADCQVTNIYTADTGYSTCPSIYTSQYAEIDITECDLTNWCQLALANYGNSGSGGSGFPVCGYPVDTQFHVFTMVWTATVITVSVDGQPTGCSYASPMWTIPAKPQFLILQTQTGGSGGTPNDSLLPATFQIDYVKVTQP
ncbi:MAG: family 16 glycosylhydrolase [Proteobacteria bacterium]|nr:family 16 glycosylhydrolase [Pseudomonadota bacterium]